MKRFFFCFLLFFAFFSCKKDKDTQTPLVEIVQPYKGQQFIDTDDFVFELKTSDDKKVTAIKVSIVNASQQPVSAMRVFNGDAAQLDAIDYLRLEDQDIVPGLHYLSVKVSDGVNETSVYQEIYISVAPKTKKAVYVVSDEGLHGALVQKIDSAYNLNSAYYTVPGDYLAAGLSSRYSQLVTVGQYSGALSAFNLKKNKFEWTVAAKTSSLPYYTALYREGKTTYAGLYDGVIEVYDERGKKVQHFSNNSDRTYYPVKIVPTGKFIVILEQPVAAGVKRKIVVHHTTGATKNEFLLDKIELVDWFVRDQTSLYLLCNKEQQAQLYIYDLENNLLDQPKVIGGTISCGTLIDANNVLYHDGKDIIIYRSANNSTGYFKVNFSAKKMVFDNVNNHVIVLQDASVAFLEYPSGALVKTVPVSERSKHVLLQYNK